MATTPLYATEYYTTMYNPVLSSDKCSQYMTGNMMQSDSSMASMIQTTWMGTTMMWAPSMMTPAAQCEMDTYVMLWQAILLLMSFGAIALFLAIVHRLVRKVVFFDGHLLDTFFDAGGNATFGMVAVAAISQWVWSTSFSWSSNMVVMYGIAGQFWFAASGAVHLLVFSVLAGEIRIKAPGAKTYLQLIRARFGKCTHVIIMIFALVANLLIGGMVLSEGSRMLSSVIDGLSSIAIIIIIAILAAIYTVAGGMGGILYVAYVSCVVIFAIVMVWLMDMTRMSSSSFMYDMASCMNPMGGMSEEYSAMTFLSKEAMVQGIVLILSGFSVVFVDQSYWQIATTAKPHHGVWGFLLGGIAWFAVPFAIAIVMGMGYMMMAMESYSMPLSMQCMMEGLVPMMTSGEMRGVTGQFMMFTLVMIAIFTTISAQILSMASIVIYDIYQPYINVFCPTPIQADQCMPAATQVAIRNEEYLEYEKKCNVWKYVLIVASSFLHMIVALIIYAIGIDTPWLFCFLGVLVGSCVIPIALSVLWHRITGPGVFTGAVGGMVAGLIAWLSMASTMPGGLTMFRQSTSVCMVMLVGNVVSMGVGGILCIVVSVTCGGCDRHRKEECEWSDTMQIDNPIMPWSTKYASCVSKYVSNAALRPHFYTLRRVFKWAEICAYILGIGLSLILILVWPALMTTVGVFSESVLSSWCMVVMVWAAHALAFVVIVPLLGEIIQVCKQATYNRHWVRTGSVRSRLNSCAETNSTRSSVVKVATLSRQPSMISLASNGTTKCARPQVPCHQQMTVRSMASIPMTCVYPQPTVVEMAPAPTNVVQCVQPAPMMQCVQQPPVMQSVQPPPVMQMVQPPPVMQSVQPPPVMQMVQPPPVMQMVQPPPVMQMVQPPPVMQSVQPPPVMQMVQPPPVMQSVQPPPVMQMVQPPPVMQCVQQAPTLAPQAQGNCMMMPYNGVGTVNMCQPSTMAPATYGNISGGYQCTTPMYNNTPQANYSSSYGDPNCRITSDRWKTFIELQ